MERNSTRQTDQPKQAQKPKQKQAQQPKSAQAQTQKSKQTQEALKPKQKQASKPKQTKKPTKATKSAQKRKSGQTSQPEPKQKSVSKPKTAQKRKSGQTNPTLSAYEARRKAEEARKQADLARIIQELNDIGNASSSEPIDLQPPKDNGDGEALLFIAGFFALGFIGFFFIWGFAYLSMKLEERHREPVEIKSHYKNVDPNRSMLDIAYWDNENMVVYYPEDLDNPSNAPSAAAPADTITVSYQDYQLYRAMKNRYSGVELDLGHGISIQTGLDESEIMDQIAADGDIYSLTDYFDEYVGD